MSLLSNILAGLLTAVLIALVAIVWRSRSAFLPKVGFFPGVLVRAESNQRQLKDMMLKAFESAEKVDLLAIRGLALIGLKEALLRRGLTAKSGKPFKMRVLLLDPTSTFVAVRAAEIGETAVAVSTGITYSLNELLETRQRLDLKLEVKLYDALPAWRVLIADDRAFVSWYIPGADSYDVPMHVVDNTNLSLFKGVTRHFESVWQTAQPPRAASVFTAEDAVNLLRAFGCSDSLIWHCKAVSRIAVSIGENALASHKDLDLRLVEIGALLHDIGKAKSGAMDHGVRGAQHIRSSTAIVDDEFREKVARIVERHIGSGLTKNEVRTVNEQNGLSIPEADYLPETLEEKIVAVADKMVEGNHEKTFDEQLAEKVAMFGEASQVVRRLRGWREQLRPYLK